MASIKSNEATALLRGEPARRSWSLGTRLISGALACVGFVCTGWLMSNTITNNAGMAYTGPKIWYLHIPKTATPSMLKVAYGVCPDMPRVDITTPECEFGPERCVFGTSYMSTCTKKFLHMSPAHHVLTNSDPHWSERVMVGMFRDPTRRVASGFVHAFHDCPTMQSKYDCDEHSPDLCPGVNHITEEKVREYFVCVKECQGRMVTGYLCVNRASQSSPVDIDLAKRRIEENFVYVGITERFHDSVVDFHKLVGDPHQVHKSAFVHSNTNRGGKRGDEVEKEVAEIITRLGLVDAVDEAVYAAAPRKNDEFHAQLAGASLG